MFEFDWLYMGYYYGFVVLNGNILEQGPVSI